MGNLVNRKEIAVGDLAETYDNKIGVITDISRKGLCLSTIEDDIKIYCKDIRAIRYLPPKCLKHKSRNCEICNTKHICEICGKEPGDFVLDPYDLEVNEVHNICCLCDECYQERVDNI